MDSYWWIWAVLAVVFIVAEIVTTGFFLLVFGVAAAVALVVALLGVGIVWQLAVFVGVSLILIPVSRRIADRITKPQPPGVGADRFVGGEGIVIEDINMIEGSGRVRLDHDEWYALSVGDHTIAKDTKIRVVDVQGTKVVVEPIQGGE